MPDATPDPRDAVATPDPHSQRVLALCSGATFIAFLDVSVVNIAFPDILKDFSQSSISALTWIVSGYAVMFAALLTPAGRVADSLGRRKVFLTSLALFTLASLACAVAPSVGWLIGARFVQGAAAAGMIPAALGLILATTARERIPTAVAAWSAAAGFSAVVGPAVGGLLLQVFSWRSVFYINLPFGAVLLFAGLSVLPRQEAGPRGRLPDPIGAGALALGIAGLVSALTEGDKWGWSSVRTIGLGAAGLALVALAVLRSRDRANAAIDPGVWRSPAYKLANLALGLLSMSMFAWMLGGPLFTTAIWHWSTLQTAGALSIGAVMSMIGSLSAGRITDPVARVWAAALGCLLFAGSTAIWASPAFGSTSNFWGGWVPSALLGGAGIGLGLTCLSTIAAATVTPLKFAAGLGMTLTVRQLGGALGVAGLAAIISSSAVPGSVASFHHVYLAATVVCVLCAVSVAGLLLVLRPAAAAAAAPSSPSSPSSPTQVQPG
jgi:EmrB/QacA subfamily drug resistance transporter